jgi:hypothetical protein
MFWEVLGVIKLIGGIGIFAAHSLIGDKLVAAMRTGFADTILRLVWMTLICLGATLAAMLAI